MEEKLEHVNSATGIALFTVSLLIFAVFVTIVLHRYLNWRKTRWYVLVSVWIGWYFSYLVILLVPLDVSSSDYETCILEKEKNPSHYCATPWINLHIDVLEVIWRIVYWSNFILCWVVYPVMQSYVTAGEFTVAEKIKSAIKDNLIFYLVAVVSLIVVLVIYVIRKRSLDITAFEATLLAAGNAWGLLLLILLMGYGLSEIPKRLWKQGSRGFTLKWYRFQTATMKESYDESSQQLDKTLKLVKKYSEKIDENDPIRPFVDTIISKCPLQYKDIRQGEGEAEKNYSKLVALHKKVMFLDHEVQRTHELYEMIVKKTIALEDEINSKRNPEKKINWTFQRKRLISGAFFENVEWFWRIYMLPRFFQMLALICGGLSLIVIWSEMFFSIDTELSIFYQAVTRPTSLPVLLQWFLVFSPVLYIALCSYWALFQVRIFNYYRLVPHHQTDSNSILFSAAYLCRLAPSLTYNFLLMINSSNSAFKSVMGDMESIKAYLLYFPFILILLCFITFFNLHNRLLHFCCIKKWRSIAFDEDYSDEIIERGKTIIAREREQRVDPNFKNEDSTSLKSEGGSLLNNSTRTTPRASDIGRKNVSSSPSKSNSSINQKDKNSPYPNFSKIFGRDSNRKSTPELTEDIADLIDHEERGAKKISARKW